MSNTFPINVQEPSATFIKEGRKTIEGRLQKGKFLDMEVGDILILNREIKLEITRIAKYKTFREMLEKEKYQNAVTLAKNLNELWKSITRYIQKKMKESWGF